MTPVLGAVDVTMPQLGETVAEGTVTRWLKQVGDQVTAGEPLFEVSTDKVDTEVPATVSGRLAQILVPVDATVPVGARLAVVDPGDAAPDRLGGPTRHRHHVSPRARRLLREHGLDPSAVQGSGPDGRVMSADVVTSVSHREQAVPDTGTVVRESGFVAVEVDFYAIDLVRAELDYLPFVAYAAIEAIRMFPQVNTGRSVHLGVDGSVIADAGDLRLAALAGSIARAPSDGGPAATFLLRNSGQYGTRFSRLPRPAAATGVLALDAVQHIPVAVPTVDGYALAVHPVGWVSFTFDAAVVDGVAAARFIGRIRDILRSTEWRDC